MKTYSVFSATLDSDLRQQMFDAFGSAAKYTNTPYGFECFLFPTTVAATLGFDDPNAVDMAAKIMVETDAEKETDEHMTWDEFDAWADATMQLPPQGIQIDFSREQCLRLKEFHLDKPAEE